MIFLYSVRMGIRSLWKKSRFLQPASAGLVLANLGFLSLEFLGEKVAAADNLKPDARVGRMLAVLGSQETLRRVMDPEKMPQLQIHSLVRERERRRWESC